MSEGERGRRGKEREGGGRGGGRREGGERGTEREGRRERRKGGRERGKGEREERGKVVTCKEKDRVTYSGCPICGLFLPNNITMTLQYTIGVKKNAPFPFRSVLLAMNGQKKWRAHSARSVPFCSVCSARFAF